MKGPTKTERNWVTPDMVSFTPPFLLTETA